MFEKKILNRKIIFLFVMFSFHCHFTKPSSNRFLALLLGLASGVPITEISIGSPLDLDGNGSIDGVVVDIDLDGVADGLDLDNNGIPEFVFITNGIESPPSGIDLNGDGNIDYYICYVGGTLTLTTDPNCSGNPVVLLDTDSNGTIEGIDTDRDGVSNDSILIEISSDNIPPQIFVNKAGGIYGSFIDIELSCVDNVSPGSIIYTINGPVPNFNDKIGKLAPRGPKKLKIATEGDGDYSLQAICRDARGNVSDILVENYTRDSNVPSIQISSQSHQYISSNPGSIQETTVVWKSDVSGPFEVRRNTSNCQGGSVLVSGVTNANSNLYTNISALTDFTSDGSLGFTICVKNPLNQLVGKQNFSVVRDDSFPSLVFSPETGSYSSPQSVHLSCTDTRSGCEKIVYTISVGTPPVDPVIVGFTGEVSVGVPYASVLQTSDDSITYIKARAKDFAGNVSSVSMRYYTTASEVSNITINSVTTPISSNNSTIQWQSSRPGNYSLRRGGTNCSSGSILTGTNASGFVSAGETIVSSIQSSSFVQGNNTLRICVENLLGNFGFSTTNIVKDVQPPTLAFSSPSSVGPNASGTTLNFTCSDGSGSGCKKIIFTTNGSDPSFLDGSGCTIVNGSLFVNTPILPNGSYTIRAIACDHAGNTSEIESMDVTIGPPSAPTITSVIPGNGSLIVVFSTIPSVTSYRVYFRQGTGVQKSDSFVSSNSSPIVLSGLTNGFNYSVSSTSSHSGGESNLSNELSALPGKSLFIYATNNTYKIDSTFNGISGANAICNSDSSKPSSGSYKALVFGSSSVIQGYWSYKNSIGNHLFTADSVGTLPLTLNTPIGCGAIPFEVWTGGSGQNCDNWSTIGSQGSLLGRCDNQGESWWNHTTSTGCRGFASVARRIYCVEQP